MNVRINLNGRWQLRWGNHQRGDRLNRAVSERPSLAHRSFVATVPGAVHLDLIKAGIIEEPGVGVHCLQARWVEEFIWYYRRRFRAVRLRKGERAWLVFQTLDLVAEVYLNGRNVGKHANAFRPCRIEVTEHLKAGWNDLTVMLESGLHSVAERPVGPREGDTVLHKRHWLRQTQSTFGWDWSERLLNVGIRGDVYLELASRVRLDCLVATTELSEDLATGTVTARVFAENLTGKSVRARLSAGLAGSRLKSTIDVRLEPGLHAVETKFAVPSPRLWWPVGRGPQDLSRVWAELAVEDLPARRLTRQVGFRRVRINQAPHPDGGRFFVLEVNNQPVFCKGGNLVPADLILSRIDRKRSEGLVRQALAANFNLLRVWGGGLYESDDFYDLCDRAGVLVWQEFVFACARYPAYDPGFLQEVKQEAAHQVRRLAHHASLVVWCGNNEIATMYDDMDRQDRFAQGREPVLYPDHALYSHVLPRILEREDGTRFYWPSSPGSPDLRKPNDDLAGDQHPWSIGFGDNDFRKYREMVCRFPNEGGILGPTALPTVKAALDGAELGSFAWEIHDNGVNSWGVKADTDEMLRQWLGLGLDKMSVEDYVYYAGVVQGEGLVEYIRNFRRRMFSSASAIFWMYNDCWPMVRSWTIVDYYLRRTPAFHPVRRAFAPLAVAISCEDNRVRIHGINEGPTWTGELRYGLFRLAGGLPIDCRSAVTLPGNASTPIAEFDRREWKKRGDTTHGAFAILSRDGQEVARDRLFLPLFREMRWPETDVRARVKDGRAIFESETFAWRVCLDLGGERPLADNFFDVLPGIPTLIAWPAKLGTPKVLRTGNLRRG